MLCRHSRKLAFFAPYTGGWGFYSLALAGSPHVQYNRQPAPEACSLTVGDLICLDGLELIVESVEGQSEVVHVPREDPIPCEIAVTGERSVRATTDLLIGYDPCCGLCFSPSFDLRHPTAVINLCRGNWHLHELDGNALIRNGAATDPSVVLTDGDRIRLHDKELCFQIGMSLDASRGSTAHRLADVTDQMEPVFASSQETLEKPVIPTQQIDPVYRKAKGLCQQLMPILHKHEEKLSLPKASGGRIRSWVKLLRRPRTPGEKLERLQFLLSGSPAGSRLDL